MKYKTLLPGVLCLLTVSLTAQQSVKISGFAITGPTKGERGWKQVRQIDMKTGAELKSVYIESEETEILNARTGNPVVKKDVAGDANKNNVVVYGYSFQDPNSLEKKLVVRNGTTMLQRRGSYDKPFATTSAACAYDKKHQRLYYTPMGIAQLRYIDLKAKKPTVYYFEDEKFGVVGGMHDGANQVARMVIGADGNGYALSNNAEHLLKFTTGKKPEITDLGAIADDPSNGRFTIHSSGAYGGDMVAGKSGNLYVLTASRHVFKINISEKTALHLGVIKGLPTGYQTNGALVEEGSNIIVCSGDSPEGYYRFDLNTLQAEKYTGSDLVYNASDLAGSNLLADKEKAKENTQPEQPVIISEELVSKPAPQVTEIAGGKAISIYPNPVTGNEVKISFNDLPAGRYMLQLTDISGKIVTSSVVNVYGKNQVETFRLPNLMGKGNYLVKVLEGGVKNVYTEKIVVQ